MESLLLPISEVAEWLLPLICTLPFFPPHTGNVSFTLFICDKIVLCPCCWILLCIPPPNFVMETMNKVMNIWTVSGVGLHFRCKDIHLYYKVDKKKKCSGIHFTFFSNQCAHFTKHARCKISPHAVFEKQQRCALIASLTPLKSLRFPPSAVQGEATGSVCVRCEWQRWAGISLYIDCNCFSLLMRLSSPSISLLSPVFGQVSAAQGRCS